MMYVHDAINRLRGGYDLLEGGGDELLTLGWELEFCCPEDNQECDICEGSGAIAITCPSCNGREEIECPICEGDGYVHDEYDNEHICGICSGRGVLPCNCSYEELYITCPECNGEGYLERVGVEQLYNKLRKMGELKNDSSINHSDTEWGAEFASQVLKYGQDNIQCYVNDVMDIIDKLDGDSNPYATCGLHVHVRPKDGWTGEHAEALAQAWYYWAEEEFLTYFCPVDDRIEEYAKKWETCGSDDICLNKHDVEYFIPSIGDGNTYIEYLGGFDVRYCTLNFTAYVCHGTVEFRLFDGTNNAVDILEALNCVAKLVLAVEEGYDGSKERFYALLETTNIDVTLAG